MNKKNELLQEKKEKQNDEKEEIKRLENEINKDKQVMLNRLQKIMTKDEEYTKEEVNDYVFKGIKPQKKSKEGKNEESSNDENKGNGKNAFITSLNKENK